jgi:Ulp1 family protease
MKLLSSLISIVAMLNKCSQWLDQNPEEWTNFQMLMRGVVTIPDKAVNVESGLPISLQYSSLLFTAHSISYLKPRQKLNDELMDLFSILECQLHDNVEYFPTSLFVLYRIYVVNQKRRGEDIIDRNIRRNGRQQQMLQRNIWIVIINWEDHWQTLAIINPGKTYCTALLMYSCIASLDERSSNFDVVNRFAIYLVNEVCGQLEMPRFCNQNLLHQCLVPIQPNAYDCGPFALLDLKHVLCNKEHLLTMSLDVLCKEFSKLYTVPEGISYRKYLFWRYADILNQY